MRVDRPSDANCAQHQRGNGDQAEKFLRVIQRAAERLPPVTRRFEAQALGSRIAGATLSRHPRRQFQMQVVIDELAGSAPSSPVAGRSASRR